MKLEDTEYGRQRLKPISLPLAGAILCAALLFGGCAHTTADSQEAQGDGSNSLLDAVIRQTCQSLDDEYELLNRDSALSEQRSTLNIKERYVDAFVHGEKPTSAQKYIVLHDTEGTSDAESIIDWWSSNGNLVASHFIVNKDGSIWQCVPLDKIAHHAGYGDAGHNALFGTEDESRDDMAGSSPIGSWAPDYGMNSYSIGIEMVHMSGERDYPAEQLEAVDSLIAYIDNYYGFESQIIDHKDWRTGNSDTSPEFAPYLDSYKTKRAHA